MEIGELKGKLLSWAGYRETKERILKHLTEAEFEEALKLGLIVYEAPLKANPDYQWDYKIMTSISQELEGQDEE